MWGGTVLTTELSLDLTLQTNASGNTSFIEYPITEPETGYVPIGWSVKSFTNESYFSSCNTAFIKKSGVWNIQFKNLNVLAAARFIGVIRIAWVKA